MTKATVKTRDIVVVRQYTYRGVSVLVEVNRAKKIASFVEVDMGHTGRDYKIKKWSFGERGPEYMNGWLLILEAMQEAIKAVKVEFDEIKESETKAMINMMMDLSKFKDKK